MIRYIYIHREGVQTILRHFFNISKTFNWLIIYHHQITLPLSSSQVLSASVPNLLSLIIHNTGCLLIIELFNLAIIQTKINIKALLRWFFCTTEWDILIFSFLNDLNRTFNRHFYTFLKYCFLGMSEVKVKKQHYKIFNTRTFWSITRPSLGL